MYIKQKNADVYIANATGDLTQHPAIVFHGDLFEIIDKDIPEDYGQLNFSDPTIPFSENNLEPESLSPEIDALKASITELQAKVAEQDTAIADLETK